LAGHMTPLDGGSDRRRDLYLKTHTHSQETQHIHAQCEIRIREPSKRENADRHLRQRCHLDRQTLLLWS